MKWLSKKRHNDNEEKIIAPVYLDRINIRCPNCGQGGMWPLPEGFRCAIGGHLMMECSKGHRWGISGIWAEDKESKGGPQ